MEKVSMSDIAKRAQVSLGTVSNVLNNKGNVRVETIRKVEEAVKELGYVRNDYAQGMRNSDSNVIFFLIPTLNHSLETLITDLIYNLNCHRLELKVIEVNALTDKSILINQIKQGNYRMIICLSTISYQDIITLVPEHKLIMIGSEKVNKNYITFDLEELLQLPVELHHYAIISAYDSFSLVDGVKNTIKYQTGHSPKMLDSKRTFKDVEHYHFIVFSDKTIASILSYVSKENYNKFHFIILTSNDDYLFQHSLNIQKLYFSSNELAMSILKGLAELKKQPDLNYQDKISLHATNLKSLRLFEKRQTLKLLLLDNPFSKGLKQMTHTFTYQTNLTLDITECDFETLNQIIMSERTNEFDLIRLDVSYFPWQAETLFRNLKDNLRIQAIQQTMPNWHYYSYINEQLFGLPVDPSIQMMLYRKDVFNNPIIQKSYDERYNRPLTVPSTYEELAVFTEFYHTLGEVDQVVAYPIALNNGSEILLASEFLPYFYSIGGTIEFVNNRFMISPQPYIETLEHYRNIQNNALVLTDYWWNSEIDCFNHSDTAIIIGYTNHLNQIKQSDYGYESVPGKTPAFGGGLIGITKESKHYEESIVFLEWLYQYQVQEQLASLGVGVPMTHLFDERDNHRKFPFLSYANKNFSNGKRLQTSDKKDVLNTIEIERIIGNEILNGLKHNRSDLDILLQTHHLLNANRANLVRSNA